MRKFEAVGSGSINLAQADEKVLRYEAMDWAA